MLDVGVGVALDAQGAGLPQTALRIARDGVLDLDDVRAPVGEHGSRRGHEPVHGDFEDADAFERAHYGTTTANDLVSRNSSSPATPLSRPTPDCL